ncbi:hypothetical protein [Actinomadura oligospora]|uniref:hypothetical protein n=1 Tax=Actinomadura oligospora TaxID=111804 RepID=UPI00047A446F|nr:hypothetical protein [Actinomadura oligospora]
MAKTGDGPWTMGRMVNVRRGERLDAKQTQHRPKGARSGKQYRTSDRPDGLRSDWGTAKRRPSQERARAKRRIRREMERREAAIAPPLKNKPMKPKGGLIATDYAETIHAGMGHDTKAHAQLHAKRASGIRMEGCK